MSYPIYRRNEPRSLPSPCTVRYWTPEEAARYDGEFHPAKNFVGEVIKPPVVLRQTTKKDISNKSLGQKKGERSIRLRKYPHVTKEFIQAELAAGKSLNLIGEENLMSVSLIFHRAESLGLYKPKERIRGAGKYKGK